MVENWSSEEPNEAGAPGPATRGEVAHQVKWRRCFSCTHNIKGGFIPRLQPAGVILRVTLLCFREWYTNGDYLVLLVSVVIILPLSLLRNLGYLGYTVDCPLLCMVFFLIVVIIKKFQIPCPLPNELNALNETLKSSNASLLDSNTTRHGLQRRHLPAQYFVFNSQTVYAVPILTFAFVCHPAILPMYEELKEVANVSFLAMFIMYLLAALFGYLTFKYYKSDVLLLIVRLAVLTAVTLTVPVVLFPIRTSVNHLLCPTKNFSWVRHTAITVGLLAGTNAMVILVPTIKDIFGFIGASAAAMLIFILPSAFYLKLVKKEPMQSMQKLGAAAFLVLGFLVMIGCMSLIIVDWVHQFSNNKKSDGH
uniref:Sodium-coupled neutral amino acid symporter 2 n=1 Tax=Salarias fasciatus TaxID=181472 RepID=A0A672HES5_SALFA